MGPRGVGDEGTRPTVCTAPPAYSFTVDFVSAHTRKPDFATHSYTEFRVYSSLPAAIQIDRSRAYPAQEDDTRAHAGHCNTRGLRGLGRPLGQALPHHLDPPPQPEHTPAGMPGFDGRGGGRGGEHLGLGPVVERDRGLLIPGPGSTLVCPRVRFVPRKPAVVVGARFLGVGQPTAFIGARFPHRLPPQQRLGTPPSLGQKSPSPVGGT